VHLGPREKLSTEGQKPGFRPTETCLALEHPGYGLRNRTRIYQPSKGYAAAGLGRDVLASWNVMLQVGIAL
jgi:hypothetical protein